MDDGNSKKSNRDQASALIIQAIKRTHGFELHPVQVQAILSGSKNTILEMQTGEGKTVVTGAIAALQTLSNSSVHVGTTNAYLAERDRQEMGAVFDLLKISHGLLSESNSESQSRRVYRSSIVYGPGYQFGFDYLRDQMILRQESRQELGSRIMKMVGSNSSAQNLLQAGRWESAIIDEADSVMIDEALTPLIISLPSRQKNDPTPYRIARQFIENLTEDEDYIFETATKRIKVFESTMSSAHKHIAERRNIFLSRPWKIYIENAIRAKIVLRKNVDYVVVEGEVQIVDQYTGRILPDRTWQSGLHQAVEVKEGVPIKPGRESTATITRQRYLQMYHHLCGLTGTATSSRREFESVYGCRVQAIATNAPCIRRLLKPRFFADLDAKLNAIAKDVEVRHSKGQPILIGTRTIEESLEVESVFRQNGLEPAVLNGIQDEEEAEIVSVAGKCGAITIATNMAGRGTDIKLDAEAMEQGGLHVIGAAFNESARIDRQLAGRAARQGHPGSVQFFCSATDAILQENESSLGKQIIRSSRRNGESANFFHEIQRLQKKIEHQRKCQRSDMILRDRWLDSVRESIEKK